MTDVGAYLKISGLDVEGETLAYVRFIFVPEDGMVTDPVLILTAADGDIRHEVPLGHDVAVDAQNVVVDLSPDGEIAIVWFRHPTAGPAGPTVVVDQLGQGEPRVRVLTTAEGARFLPDDSPAEGGDDLDAALRVVQAFVAALEQGDLDAAAGQLSDYAVGVSDQPDADTTLRQFREDFAWLLGSPSIEWYTSRSFAFPEQHALPIVTAVSDVTGRQRRATAFLLVTADVDHGRFTTSVEIPTWAAADDEVVLTLSLATPELPTALALWYRIDP